MGGSGPWLLCGAMMSARGLGDVDQPTLGAGATLRLPVNVEGSLVAVGDAHGAQGNGEITGVAVEPEAEVTMRARDRGAAGYGTVRRPAEVEPSHRRLDHSEPVERAWGGAEG